MRLEELLDVDLLVERIKDGYVSERAHPEYPRLRVFNYTSSCQYERAWDDVTRQCRGLVVRFGYGDYCRESLALGEVIARPWPKFYNYGEHEAGALDPDARVEVTDKIDGSLGILYSAAPGQWAIATRGSFDSDQARVASRIWRDRYWRIEPQDGWTYLFEIVYPANHVVVDYGDLTDLVLLGSVGVETGRVRGPTESSWPGIRADVFPEATLREALAREPRQNAEGLVVRFLDSGLMLKLKQDDYVELHRIVTGLSERVVWERLGAGETVEDICLGLPDEFAEWVEDVRVGLQFRADDIWSDAMTEYLEIMSTMTDDFSRKDFAAQATDSPLAKYLFLILDGKDPRPAIWRSIKPEAS